MDDRLDACLRLVSNRHRRAVINSLRHEANGETTIDDLVDRLHGGEPISVTERSTGRDKLAIRLTHAHLPKLAEHGVVDYDPEGGTVRYRPDEQVEAILDALPEELPRANP